MISGREFSGMLALVFALALASSVPALSQEKAKEKGKSEKPAGLTRLRIEVTGGENSKPVEGASVYVRYVEEKLLGKDKKIEMNVKTNPAGVTRLPEIPTRKVLIQVIAEGWKTFGRWYDLEEGEQIIKIHLDKPPRWY